MIEVIDKENMQKILNFIKKDFEIMSNYFFNE